MNLDFSPEDVAFRDEVRAFIAENYPPELRGRQVEGDELGKEDFLSWHRILAKKGWIAPSWPKEWGGTGWTPTQKYIWSRRAGAGRHHRRPALRHPDGRPGDLHLRHAGAEGQVPARHLQWRYLVVSGLFGAGAGSDLASLSTRAERIKGDDSQEYYLVNGQKTWTTLAQHADWGFFLVRTDPAAKKQEGDQFPADRHEDAGDHRAPPDHHRRWA